MTSRTHVRLVRHGEVEAAHRITFYGGAEVPLSAEGAQASVTLAAALAASAPPDEVWSSPLTRALAVAEPLATTLGLPVHIDEAFRELDRGDWTHRSRDEVGAQAVAHYLADPEEGAAPGGERESELARRVWSGLDRVVAGAPGRRLVIVTHGHVIRIALRRLLGWDAPTSLRRFVPYHGVVELLLAPDGTGEVRRIPEGVLPEALRPPR